LKDSPADCTQTDNKMRVCVCPLGCLDRLVLGFDEFVISYVVQKCIKTVNVSVR